MALVFVHNRQNKYSIAALIGTVEADERLQNLPLRTLRSGPDLSARVEALARTHRQVVLGFSFMTPAAPRVGQSVRGLRQHFQSNGLSNVTLLAGGPHPSGDWRGTLEMGFDVVVVGEGEKALPALLERLCAGRDLGDVPGLAYRQAEGYVHTGAAEQVESLDDYPPFAPKFGRFAPIEISRGCPVVCRFCQTSSLKGARMRHRSVENVAHWAEVSKQAGRPVIRFITPNALAYGPEGGEPRLDRLEALLRAVSAVVGRENTYLGTFPSEVRPESVSRDALELIRRYAANDNLVIGAQSGSERMLQLAHRGHTVEDVYRAVELTLQAGLAANVDFIFGLPGETESDRAQTRRVIEDLAALGARVHSHAFIPLAGTAWAQAPPGQVDGETQQLLERLAGRGQHYGQWRRQQRAAQEVARFREGSPSSEQSIP